MPVAWRMMSLLMSFVRSIVLFLLAASPLAAQTRIAGVEIARAFSSYYVTQASMKEFNEEREAIAKDPRREQLDALERETNEAEANLAKLADSDEETKVDAQRRVELKQDELRSLRNALAEAQNKRLANLNRRVVSATQQLLQKVSEAAVELGKQQGYDLVIDTSGNTNTGLPFVLYARKLPDLTEQVISILNADAPSPPTSTAAAPTPPKPDVAPPPTGNEYD